jgi:gliding motility-associated-like protein
LPPVDNTICSGQTIHFDNATEGATIHKWYYRVKGTSDQNEIRSDFEPDYTFVTQGSDNPTIYEVVYEGSNTDGCMGFAAIDITVYRNSIAGFNKGTVPPFVGGSASLNIQNTSTIIDATDFSYSWDFGVGATPEDAADNPGPSLPVTYNTPGAKKVTLTVTNRTEPGCKSVHSETFTITVPPLTADFTVYPLASCVPATIEVNNIAGAADKFEWVLEDENSAEIAVSNLTQPSFDIAEAGKYTIKLVATLTSTHQTATKSVTNIEVFPKPHALFTARPKIFFVPDTEVVLFNDSEGANEFLWKFGDGRETFERDPPPYTYPLEGLYKIELEARYNHGMKDLDGDGTPDENVTCSDTASLVVTAKEGGATKIPNAFTPNPNGPTGGVADNTGYAINDRFLPITSGVQEFLMQIFDRWGNLVFESKDKDIGWDGYDKDGRLMPAGVYVFKLILRLADDQRETRIGDVTLIR